VKKRKTDILTDLQENKMNMPLFSGNYLRDSAVSESERAADVSMMIFEKIEKTKKKKK